MVPVPNYCYRLYLVLELNYDFVTALIQIDFLIVLNKFRHPVLFKMAVQQLAKNSSCLT